MTRTNLIICCAGDDSYHPTWIHPDRTYDICVIYYGNNPEKAATYKTHADLYFERKGYKFGLLRDCILPYFDAHPTLYDTYKYIWIPDDDISIPPQILNQLFEFSHKIGADIFQPSVANNLRPDMFPPGKQWISWLHTSTSKVSKYRRINHPEIMMPGFSADAFKHILLRSLRDYPTVVIGWTLDEYWEKLWKEQHPNTPNCIYIYDHICAFHMRPVSLGSTIHQIGYKETELYPFKGTQTTTLEVFKTLPL